MTHRPPMKPRLPAIVAYLICLPSRVLAAELEGSDRSLSAALQNVNGMSSIFALIPILTGKVQNVKMVAARTFPGSLVVAGLGGGRVLTKLQLGVLLSSSSLYENLVGEFSYHHQEYVNKFSPALIHIPTGTPERHSSNIIINHNPSEVYLVEAWFQTQGRPARVNLKQNNHERMFVGVVLYIIFRTGETYIEIRNAAEGAWLPLLVFQIVGSLCWVISVVMLQLNRGQSCPSMLLNRVADPKYRCLKVVVLGHQVETSMFSFSLDCLQSCHLFHSNYSGRNLQIVGGMILASAIADLIATVLIVGLTTWAYPWLAMQLVMATVKVTFSLEPLRQIAIKSIEPLEGKMSMKLPECKKDIRLPLQVNTTPQWKFTQVCVGHNVVEEVARPRVRWISADPGIYIGQPYYFNGNEKEGTRYLAKEGETLSLATEAPQKESNQALPREFLACLGEIVKANRVPSRAFVEAAELTAEGMRRGMGPEWYAFGTKDLMTCLHKSKTDIFWAKWA